MQVGSQTKAGSHRGVSSRTWLPGQLVILTSGKTAPVFFGVMNLFLSGWTVFEVPGKFRMKPGGRSELTLNTRPFM